MLTETLWGSPPTRPKIVVVESVHPITRKLTLNEWDFILFEAGYTLALFDGLNAYFVVNDELELIKALSLPPNYADNYVKFEFLQIAHALIRKYWSRKLIEEIFFYQRMVTQVHLGNLSKLLIIKLNEEIL